jgi:quercetin dioxygenase-like cupin family protein
MIAGKVWGRTEKLIETAVFELHEIRIQSGGECSKHYHKTKHNWFHVIEGYLNVRVWKDYKLIDVTVLAEGQNMVVAPGEYHQFFCEDPCVALEAYWSTFDANDIVRETCGSLKD